MERLVMPASLNHRERKAVRSVGLWLSWWGALLLAWLLFVDTFDGQELIVGAIAAALAAMVAVAVHHRGYIRFWPRAGWLKELPYLVWAVIVDTIVLGKALWRRLVRRVPVRGSTIRVPFHYGEADGRDGARRALVNASVSLTP